MKKKLLFLILFIRIVSVTFGQIAIETPYSLLYDSSNLSQKPALKPAKTIKLAQYNIVVLTEMSSQVNTKPLDSIFSFLNNYPQIKLMNVYEKSLELNKDRYYLVDRLLCILESFSTVQSLCSSIEKFYMQYDKIKVKEPE